MIIFFPKVYIEVLLEVSRMIYKTLDKGKSTEGAKLGQLVIMSLKVLYNICACPLYKKGGCRWLFIQSRCL